MKAFIGHALGSPSSFALEEIKRPVAASGELLIKVEATSLGFVDPLVMKGLYQVKPQLPFIPGGEIVGTVCEAVEPNSRFRVGQRIAAWQFGGGLAEFVCVPEDNAVAVPEELESPEAAAILLDYLTAYYGLFDCGELKPGETLLVTGASGGVGSAAVRLANASSAVVAGLASGREKLAFVSQSGARHAIDYRREDWRSDLNAAVPHGINMVFDPVGGPLFEPAFRSLAKRGRHLVVGFAADTGIPSLPANLPLLKSAALVGVDARYLWQTDKARTRAILSIILDLARTGRIEPTVAARHTLADAAAAFDALSDPGRIGKVVICP
ncbi:NADPH:quinone oxidoreductase family protein [Altererythrobacter sp. BO-6]|uniref:NADPH:quinone oxidoreductase family protein n=1 Tax=Altererythrobacter sp. BO-6 TaxID=2604537 RepID=UPI0013E16441|nr:NADPH:quinone oxidoreductase family protein [Altererythrobacter sp. BO-6]QIG54761.1 NADPH:quinone oxidoreductase family protein [Altererythrobacter sp. BO-6]